MKCGVLLVLLGLATAPETTAGAIVPSAPPLTPLVLYTDWYAQPEQGGFFAAVAQGYYAAEALEVEIRPGAPRMPIFPIVAQNHAPLAISNSNDVITAISEGFPLVIILAYFQRSPQGIMFDPDHPIHSFAELSGRTVMAQPASAWIRYVERKYDIKLNVIPSTWGVGRFLADPTHLLVQQAYATSEPYLVRRAGGRADMLMFFTAGYRPYRVAYSNQTFVRTHPDQVRAFVKASLAGWHSYLHGDPGPANRMIAARNRQMSAAEIDAGRDAMIKYRLVEGEPEAGESLGRLDPARLEETAATLRALKVIRNSPIIRDSIFQ